MKRTSYDRYNDFDTSSSSEDDEEVTDKRGVSFGLHYPPPSFNWGRKKKRKTTPPQSSRKVNRTAVKKKAVRKVKRKKVVKRRITTPEWFKKKLFRSEELEEMSDGEKERFEGLLEKSKLRIELKGGRYLRMFKSFLYYSRVLGKGNDYIGEVYSGLKEFEFEGLSEITIIKIILDKKVDLSFDEFQIYYVFFIELGLRKEAYRVIELFREYVKEKKKSISFEEMCVYFKKFASYESDKVKNWYLGEGNPILRLEDLEYDYLFERAFSWSILNIIKLHFRQPSRGSVCLAMNCCNITSIILANKEKSFAIMNPIDHPDFHGCDTVESLKNFSRKNLFKVLKCGEFSNMTIKDSTKFYKLNVHREIVLSKSRYLSSIVGFSIGKESKEFQESGVLTLENFSRELLDLLIRFYYEDVRIYQIEIDILVRMCLKADFICEEDLLKSFLHLLRKKVLNNRTLLDKITESIMNVGHEFDHIESIRNKLVAIFSMRSAIDEKKVNKLIRKSVEKYKIFDVIDEQNRKISMLMKMNEINCKENQRREREHNEEIQGLKNRIQLLEENRIIVEDDDSILGKRKREVSFLQTDQSNSNDESPSKRRKLD